LKTGVRTSTRGRSPLGAILAVTQAALCVLLLAGAGLFIESLARSRRVDLGFQPDRVARIIALFPEGHRTRAGRLADRACQREALIAAASYLQRLPWVEQASLAVGTPYGNAFSVDVRPPDRDSLVLDGEKPTVSAVTSTYFAAVGTPLRGGR